MNRRLAGLYAVTPDERDTAKLLAQVEAALAGGAALVQYRNKIADAILRREQAGALLELCRRGGVPLIVNDHADLAREIEADGVHLGSEDGSISEARRLLGADRIIGASCYNAIENARRARAAGADYVAFGSFFPSDVKPGAVRAPLALLADARRSLTLPVVAIGGITLANAPQLIAAGADSIAVISAVFAAPDIRLAARKLSDLFA